MPHHQNPPFEIAPDAVEHIRQWSQPRSGLRATLTQALGEEERDERGEVLAHFDGEHLVVGYHKTCDVAGWPQFEIGGHDIAMPPDTVERLRSRTLLLKTKNGRSLICQHVVVAE
jgi:hypothetical protein